MRRPRDASRSRLPIGRSISMSHPPCDTSMLEQLRRKALAAAAGSGDPLVRQQFTDLAEKNWRRHIDLNLVSNLAATSTAVPITSTRNEP